MKRWWNKSVGELLRDLFAREKTRWIAILIFLAIAAFQNWVVIRGTFDAETMSYVGAPVSQRTNPIHFSISLIWNVIAAVTLDAIILGALVFIYRESKRRKLISSR